MNKKEEIINKIIKDAKQYNSEFYIALLGRDYAVLNVSYNHKYDEFFFKLERRNKDYSSREIIELSPNIDRVDIFLDAISKIKIENDVSYYIDIHY